MFFIITAATRTHKYRNDIATIEFDPKDRHGKPLGQIPHKIIYICPKYVSEDTPAAYREWLLAIKDSLDEEVEETAYTRAEIRQVID